MPRVFFTRTTEVGTELWVSNGTASHLVKDINPGPGNSDPDRFVMIDGILYFVANDTANNRELWRSDGTTAGTYMVKDINPGGSGGLAPYELLSEINGQLFFTADEGGSVGLTIWKSDGTSTGTTRLVDMNPSGPGDVFRVLGAHNDSIYLMALYLDPSQTSYSHGELWKSDGTSAGTTLLAADIMPNEFFGVVNDRFLFRANGDLWTTDGTPAGTQLVKEDVSGGTRVGNHIFFSMGDEAHGRQLWKTDGTPAGTVLVKDIEPGLFSNEFADLNGTLVFRGTDGHGPELWISDGTESGTKILKDIWPGGGWGGPRQFLNVNGTVFFTADDGVYGTELWKTDGTAAGTVMVKEIRPGELGTKLSSDPLFWGAHDGFLYFSANTASVFSSQPDYGLWRSDGTAAGTVKIASAAHAAAVGDGYMPLVGPGDFNGDIRGDILWRNDDGTVVTWTLNGGNSVTGKVLAAPEVTWKIAQTGDYDGDGRTDVLWRHDDGSLVAWLMQGTTFAGRSLGTISAAHEIGEAGDYNGDGIWDILTRTTTGNLAIREMKSDGSFTERPYGFVSEVYQVVESGDFNEDGISDILWRRDDGALLTWMMDGNGGFHSHSFGAIENEWKVEKTGDFNGDGRSDILWRNTGSGQVVTWEINDAGGFASASLGIGGLDYQVADVIDANGDGRSDIVWRGPGGAVPVWRLLEDGHDVIILDGGGPDASWHIYNDAVGSV